MFDLEYPRCLIRVELKQRERMPNILALVSVVQNCNRFGKITSVVKCYTNSEAHEDGISEREGTSQSTENQA